MAHTITGNGNAKTGGEYSTDPQRRGIYVDEHHWIAGKNLALVLAASGLLWAVILALAFAL